MHRVNNTTRVGEGNKKETNGEEGKGEREGEEGSIKSLTYKSSDRRASPDLARTSFMLNIPSGSSMIIG